MIKDNDDTTADLVVRDAPIYRTGRWDGDWLAIKHGRIIGRGSRDAVAPLIGASTEQRSLAGSWLLPAFHDSHVHPVGGGLEMNQCNLTDVEAIDDYLEVIADYARSHPQQEWITGGGWSMTSFPGGVPSADLLDRIVSDRPVYLPNRDHHTAWVNTRALGLAGIDSSTPDPVDGRIERDPRGRPSGALHEGAMSLVASLMPAPSDAELTTALQTAQQHLHSLGIVGWQDALVGEGLGMRDTLATYLAAVERGDLTAKVVLAQWWDRDRGVEQIGDLIERRRIASATGLDASSIKIMQDGVCETHTAALIESYRDEHGRPTHNHGLSFLDADALAGAVSALDAEDFRVHIHALGDRAVRDSLDAIAHARTANGDRGTRHHLAHLQVVHEDDVPRFAALGVVANVQPLWACREEAMEELTLPFLPLASHDRQYVFGSLLRSGSRLAAGSDWPVTPANPLWGMHVAVNRRAPDQGPDVEPLLPNEALTVEQAVAAYTSGTAYVNQLENETGALRVGLAADFVAINRDILSEDPSRIAEIAVTHTFVDGEQVYAR